jgi:hypothetical protein
MTRIKYSGLWKRNTYRSSTGRGIKRDMELDPPEGRPPIVRVNWAFVRGRIWGVLTMSPSPAMKASR